MDFRVTPATVGVLSTDTEDVGTIRKRGSVPSVVAVIPVTARSGHVCNISPRSAVNRDLHIGYGKSRLWVNVKGNGDLTVNDRSGRRGGYNDRRRGGSSHIAHRHGDNLRSLKSV